MKQQELSLFVVANCPDAICLVEVKPAICTRTISLTEYKNDGYLLEQDKFLFDQGKDVLQKQQENQK